MSDPVPRTDNCPLTVDEALKRAIACHKANQLPQAERLYRAILQLQPRHPDANHNLGVLAVGVGKASASLPFFQAALEANPGPAQYWLSYVNALMAVGDFNLAREAIGLAEKRGLAPQLFQDTKDRLQTPIRGQAGANAAPGKHHDEPSAPQHASQNREEKEQLVTLFNQSRFVEAEELAGTMTRRYPDDAFAWNMLGTILRTRGRIQEALAPLQKTALLMPNFAEAHSNLAVILLELGRLAEAEASCRRAVELRPDFPAAHCNLGNTLRSLGRLSEAEASCRHAIKINPDFPEALSNLGSILKDLGRLEEAEANYRRALEIRPDYAEAHVNLGGVLQRLGRLSEAELSFRRAIEIRPNLAEAFSNLGNTLRGLGRLKEAEANCRRAIEINPRFPEALANLGNTLIELAQLTEAEVVFRRVLDIGPQLAEAHNNLGNILQELGRLSEAEASYRRALEIKPDYAKAHSNLLFCINYLSHLPVAEVFAEYRRWQKQQANGFVTMALGAIDKNPQRRLRVGYVSPDLKQHSVAYFLEPLLRAHDRSNVEVFCYAEVPRPDAVTMRLQGLADRWLRTVGISDQALARRIADDAIDILVDLAGHTANSRLSVFALKPAPVQVTWLGYPNTTGLRTMDYRLVDEVTDPTGVADALATEHLVRLENGFLCYAAPATAPQPTAPPSAATGKITFGSFNNPTKLSPTTLDAWAALLRRVPGSCLLLKGRLYNDANGSAAFLARLQSHGIDAPRVILWGRTPGLEDHLALYGQVDIALDPFPYNGTTTTCEAMWMGVPVVTLRGDRHAGRVGASLLTRMGLTEFVADSVEGYVDIAATLAQDPQRLTDLRHSLRERMAKSPLCDAPAFARQVETAYRQMWQTFCAGAD